MKLNSDIMYTALVTKDSSFEGIFYAGVKSTRVFCRPTCSARKPKRENVEFFSTANDALRHGYRPCKICSPLRMPGETPKHIELVLKRISKNPFTKMKDNELASLGVEPNRVRRWFKVHHGITFQGYQRMIRINSAYHRLTNGETVSATAYDNGYESVSGFSDAFKNLFGNTPSRAKQTGVINLARLTTPLGPMYACATDTGICLLEFTDRRMLETEFKLLRTLLNANIISGESTHFAALRSQLREYFDGTRTRFDLPLHIVGTDFQQGVWKLLQTIPYGETRSYSQQATALKMPKAIRAVARANGLNRVAIVIPCHRVIGADGKLIGYAGGLQRKQWLLEFEQRNMLRAQK
jgi:AraC family transcriptional regulator, regulatory protein of adaptative response / methylated-DNA-[protein]-cysteine methyltransferase